MKLSARNQLLLAIRHKAILWGDGINPAQPCKWTIDLRRLMLDGHVLNAAADLFWQTHTNVNDLQVGGLEAEIAPLISVILMRAASHGLRTNGFVVQERRKNYGADNLIIGELTDAPVYLVFGLLRSISDLDQIRMSLAETGQTIKAAFVLIDYNLPEDDKKRQDIAIPIRALFSLDDLGLSLASCRAGSPPARRLQDARPFAPASSSFVRVAPMSLRISDNERGCGRSGRGGASSILSHPEGPGDGINLPLVTGFQYEDGVVSGQASTRRTTWDRVGVVDDALPDHLFRSTVKDVAGLQLHFGTRSNSQTDPHGHWSTNFVGGGKHNLANIQPQMEQSDGLASILKAWKTISSEHLSETVLIRCYVNVHTYGTDGYFHTDSRRLDERTAVLYLTEEWEPDWAGETVFLNDLREIEFAALPKPNRLVVFRSDIEHAARGVSRKCATLRKTLIFKARQRRSDEFEAMSTFLCGIGTTEIGHRRGSLHDHLMRTFALLEGVGAPVHVCRAGALHSIYGTNKFKRAVADDTRRGDLAKRFGVDAEQLAFAFSLLDRPGTLESPLECREEKVLLEVTGGGKLSVPTAFHRALQLIECANLLDQNSLCKYVELSRIWASPSSALN